MEDDFWGYSEPNTWDLGQQSTDNNSNESLLQEEVQINNNETKVEDNLSLEEKIRQRELKEASENPYFIEAYEIGLKDPSALTENQKNLLDHYGFDFYKDGNTASPLIDAALLASPFLAKPALLKSLLIGTGQVIKNHPWKALDVGLTGLGALDMIEHPEDIAFETLAQKTDTFFSVKTRGIKYLARKLDNWLNNPKYSQWNSAWETNRKLDLSNNVDDLNNNVFFSKSEDGLGGGNWTLSQGLNSTKNQVLVQQLNSPKLDNWLIGKTKSISRNNANLIQEIATHEDFMSLMRPKFDALKKKYPHLVQQIGEKENLLLRWHHVNPAKGNIDLYKGLTNATDRIELNKFLIDEVGIYSGNHPLNNRGLSIDVHDQIHEWLGKRLGLRADTLKYKWAKKLDIDVGELSPGPGFMADHLVLSKEGNRAWDNYFSKLTVEQRKPYFKEYGQLIKESEKILDDLMRQYDALYAMPEGFQVVIPDEVLIEFLDRIPTDGSRILQKDIRAIVEEVANEMPRGTLDIINEAGEIRRIDLESKLFKRMQEVRRLLDEAKDLRTKRSLKAELKNLEKGIYQEAIDFKGVEKQAGWKKRLEQEKLRREGKN